MTRKITIAPSILSADFAKLGEEISSVEKAGADMIHVDVMDGHFVPNLTLGPVVISSLRKTTKLPFDVHLMIEQPQKYIEDYRKAGADIITVHTEAVTHLDRVLNQITATGAKAGVSIVPSTPESVLEYVLPLCDLVLVMSVNPGFGGQKFIPSSLEKIKNLRRMIDKLGKNIMLQVDGGVNEQTIKSVLDAGADTIVAGSAVFDGNPNNYAANIKNYACNMSYIDDKVKKLLEENKNNPHPKTNAELEEILAKTKEIGGPKEDTIIGNDWSVKGRVSDF